ncbi:MAG: amidohydrolase [Planctomycetaceae bacterium]
MIETRRHLHAHPEPSGHEQETTAYIVDQLTQAGLSPRVGRNGLGLIVDVDLGNPVPNSPRIALRADIDALKIVDAKTTSYASRREGLCHACGHDAHTTIALGAALTAQRLSASYADLSGPNGPEGFRLRFVFQPAEETAEGAQWMVEQGAVDDVTAILGCHVDPERPLGTVGIRYGALTAHCDEVEIVVEGRGGHAARPHHTQDPIAAAVSLASALFQFLPRSVDSRSPAVFTIGKFSGGTLSNVIPGRVEILGTLRTLDQEVRQRLKDRIESIVHGVKEASGTSIHLRYFEPLNAVINDPRCTAALEESSRRVLGNEGVQSISLASMGGEDFSAYLTRVPGSMLRLGSAPPGFAAPFLHSPDFDVDERVLAIGSRILLRAALLLAYPK